MRQHYKSEHRSPCRKHTPSWYDLKIVKSDVNPEQNIIYLTHVLNVLSSAVYKSITGQTPEYISSLLTYVSDHHERQTRSTTLDLLHIPRSHSANFDRAFSVQGPNLRNNLPADIRNSKSINRFKSELKRYLLYNNWNAWKLYRIRNCSPAAVGCGGRRCVWTKARSTMAPPSGVTSGFTRAKWPIHALFCRGTGLRFRNSQTWPTRFSYFGTGKPSSNFSILSIGVSLRD